MKLDGYVIVPPLNPCDKKELWLEVGYRTFATTPREAWYRFTSYSDGYTDGYWFDKGYRVKSATLEINDG